MPTNLENSAVATGLERSVCIPIPKKGNAKECSKYCTIAFISHVSKVMLKILQVRLQQYMNHELPDVQAGFRKVRGTRDQIANICWIIKKKESSRKTSISVLLIFLPEILTPACASSSQVFRMMYSACKLNKQGDSIQPWRTLPSLEPVCSMSGSNCCFLTCIQISQETCQVVWYSHLLKNFPQFIVIHTVKVFGIVNKAEIDVFLELSFFLMI